MSSYEYSSEDLAQMLEECEAKIKKYRKDGWIPEVAKGLLDLERRIEDFVMTLTSRQGSGSFHG